jgi:hypothetical protein
MAETKPTRRASSAPNVLAVNATSFTYGQASATTLTETLNLAQLAQSLGSKWTWFLANDTERHTQLALPTAFGNRLRVPISAASPMSISLMQNAVAGLSDVQTRMSVAKDKSRARPYDIP